MQDPVEGWTLDRRGIGLFAGGLAILKRCGGIPESDAFIAEIKASQTGRDMRSAALVLADHCEDIGHPAATAIREFYGQPTE